MNINVFDGSISFAGGNIQRSQDQAKFLASRIGSEAKAGLVNEDWKHFEIDPEPGIRGTVLFKGDRIDAVYLLMTTPTGKAREWTEELELERKSKHDAWLRQELGVPPYNYPWGNVTSDYDPRGCVSEIIITYAK